MTLHFDICSRLQFNSMGLCCSSDRSRTETPVSGKPLLPLTELNWKCPQGPITLAALDDQRAAFWATEPSFAGHQDIWNALKTVCETYASDLSLCQAILDAARIVVPSGDLSQGAYDERGALYTVPRMCFVSPSNALIKTEDDKASPGQEPMPKEGGVERRMVPVRLRLSSGQDLTISASLTEPLSVLAAASESPISSLLGPPTNSSFTSSTQPVLQFIFLGRRLDTAKTTLESLRGFDPDSSILQVLVLNRPSL